jgi:toxin ParE1/3/4
MSLIPDVRPEADLDIDSYIDYLAERDPLVADRFADAVDATVKMLCHNPNLGERLHADLLGEIRYRTILDFKNYLIFYRRVDSVLEIIRILHGARDYENFFD